MVIEAKPDTFGFNKEELSELPKSFAITNLKEAIDLIAPQDRELFFKLYELVDDRFTSDGQDRQNGHFKIPSAMEGFVFAQFKDMVGSDDPDKVLQAVINQWSVTVTDRYTKRKAKFNPFRQARPMDKTKPNFFLQEIEAKKDKDPFCNPAEMTPEGPFGRILDMYGTSCANLTEFAPYHEVFLGPHNPYEMRREHFISQMKKALHFGNMVYKKDPEAKHLTWGMNIGFRGGASQVHQHSQVIVDRGTMHQAEAEEFHEVAALYRQENPGREYLADWLKVHQALGLAEQFDDFQSDEGIWVVMPLTPAKERNAVVIGPKLDGYKVSEKFINICWDVIEHMMKDEADGGENVMEFNTSFYMIPFGRAYEYWGDFPPMFTFVDRGSSTSLTSDMGFMETSRTIVLSTDPKKIAPRLFRSLRQKAA